MTPKERAAMQQALEALEGVLKTGDTQVLGYTAPPAITALREALAEQAEQEPVAWGRVFDGDIIDCICPEEHALNEGDYTIPLYTHPVRTKDLTDGEIIFALDADMDTDEDKKGFLDIARAVIAADREKNRG